MSPLFIVGVKYGAQTSQDYLYGPFRALFPGTIVAFSVGGMLVPKAPCAGLPPAVTV